MFISDKTRVFFFYDSGVLHALKCLHNKLFNKISKNGTER